jgi:hypothetical protein
MNKTLVHEGTFWFLDKVLEIFESRKSEIPADVIDRYKIALSKAKSDFV